MPSFSDNDGDMDYVNNGGSENIDFNCSCIFFKLTQSPIYGSGGVSSISPANFTFNFTSEDIDADRQVDIIVSTGLIYKNNNANFTSSTYPGHGGNIMVNDFDGDSDMDIAELIPDNVKLYKNNGSGSFTEYSSNVNSFDGNGFTTGDFDNDGDMDLAASNNMNGKISILKNTLLPLTTYNIKTIVEGFYNFDINNLNLKDTLRAYLRNVNSPYSVVDYSKTVIDSLTFTGSFLFINAQTSTYYIQLIHRNGIETWSKPGGESFVQGGTLNYDFTTAASQAYGNNLIQVGSKYCIYSGDTDGDGIIDVTDINAVYNDASTLTVGYVDTDLDGNNFVDVTDLIITFNNVTRVVTAQTP